LICTKVCPVTLLSIVRKYPESEPMIRSYCYAFIFTCLCTMFPTQVAFAQGWPTKPVKIIVGSAPGGILDITARVIGEKVGEKWGVPVLVEGKLGAAGNIAGDFLAKSPPDGYTLLVGESGVWGISPHLVQKSPFDPRTDFSGVAQIGLVPVFLVIPSSIPAINLTEFIAYARKNPGKLSYASGGQGSIHQLAAELLKSMAKLDVVHVPYKGGSPAAMAVMAGDVQMAFVSYAGAQSGIASGKLRILGISTAQRSPSQPDIPTLSESGLPGYAISTTLGVIAPSKIPRNLINKIQIDILEAVAIPSVAKHINDAGGIVSTGSGEQLSSIIKSEYDKFGDLVKLIGAK
jgi:tripartite-type tricarboxylate transporter receptor subunit TctC